MSFKLSRFFQHMPNIIISLILLVAGWLGIGLAWWPTLRTAAISFLLEERWTIFFISLIFILIGILVFAYVLKDSKRRYTQIKVGDNECYLDEAFIQQYLDTYWKNVFPTQNISYDLCIKKDKIRIFAHFPALPANEQKRFLEKQQRELGNIFGRLLGYPHAINLAANFKAPPP